MRYSTLTHFFMKKLKSLLLSLAFLLACKPAEQIRPLRTNVAFIVSGGSRTVEVIDLSSLDVIDSYDVTAKTDRFPHHIYISADKSKLAIANPGFDFSKGHNALHGGQFDGGVVVLDAQTGKKLKEFEVPFANHNALFSPDDSEIWTAGLNHDGIVYVYDAYNYNLLARAQVDADPSEVIFTENEKYAVVRSGESTFLSFINIETKERDKAVKIDLSSGNVWPGYGDVVLVSNGARKSVNFVNVTTFSVVDFIDFDFNPGNLIFNTLLDELWVCASMQNQVKVFKKIDNLWTEIKSFDFPEANPHMIKFFQNGEMAILVNQFQNTAVFLDTKTKEIIKTIEVGQKPNGIAIY
ncbi:MAG: DNA-binding beta-propeller fold protein YncE [Algoriphagus sp.]|jgi:DNA-binding beta-propeller fold protein YncE